MEESMQRLIKSEGKNILYQTKLTKYSFSYFRIVLNNIRIQKLNTEGLFFKKTYSVSI